jgi:hypothetical protein
MSMTNREYFLIKLKSKPNFWYTPTVEEKKKIIFYLKMSSDSKAIILLRNFLKDENEFIRIIAKNILYLKLSKQ